MSTLNLFDDPPPAIRGSKTTLPPPPVPTGPATYPLPAPSSRAGAVPPARSKASGSTLPDAFRARREALPPPEPKRTIQERFEQWIADNPAYVELFLRFSRDVKKTGRETYGIKAVAERIRWHYHVERNGTEDFKISNDFTSRMARYLMANYPDLENFFETRQLREIGAPDETTE